MTIDFQVKNSGSLGTMTLGGELTADCVNELRSSLRTALRQVNHVVLNLEKVTTVDISCLNLFCTAHRMAIMWKKSLTLAGSRKEPFKQAAGAADSLRCADCTADRDKGCVWNEYLAS